MSVAEISEQLNLTSIKDHGWHIQVSKSTFWFSPVGLKLFCPSACYLILSPSCYFVSWCFFGCFCFVFVFLAVLESQQGVMGSWLGSFQYQPFRQTFSLFELGLNSTLWFVPGALVELFLFSVEGYLL